MFLVAGSSRECATKCNLMIRENCRSEKGLMLLLLGSVLPLSGVECLAIVDNYFAPNRRAMLVGVAEIKDKIMKTNKITRHFH